MKTAFLINGFKNNRTTAHPDYDELKNVIKSEGYRVVDSQLTWNNRTVSSFAEDFSIFYQANKSEENLVIGNSLGAMAAYVASVHIIPERLMLCSLSGFFKEDIEKYDIEYLVERFGGDRVEDFQRISADALGLRLSELGIEVEFLCGSQEVKMYPNLVERVIKSAASVKGSNLTMIEGAGHRMYEPEYVQGIAQAIESST